MSLNVKVHVQGWKGSARVKPGEKPDVMLNGILEVDGHLILEVIEIRLVFNGSDFAKVQADLIPGSFEVVTHDDDTWPELINKASARRRSSHELRDGEGSIIATVDE